MNNLSIVRSYARLENHKLAKLVVDLDYRSMTPREEKAVLADLVKQLGKPTQCPLQEFYDTPTATAAHKDTSCFWKSKEANVDLYTDGGRMKLKLEKGE